ncbi:hypothetical protein ACG7TL_006460 [Trametes sanguinea]
MANVLSRASFGEFFGIAVPGFVLVVSIMGIVYFLS